MICGLFIAELAFELRLVFLRHGSKLHNYMRLGSRIYRGPYSSKLAVKVYEWTVLPLSASGMGHVNEGVFYWQSIEASNNDATWSLERLVRVSTMCGGGKDSDLC
jgi:uncharacterized protein YwgA